MFSYDAIATKGTDTSEEKRVLYKLKNKFPVLVKFRKYLQIPNLKSITRGEDRLVAYIDNVAKSPDYLIIDIGAGRKRYKEAVALDIYNYPDIEIAADATKLPFSDNSVDMVISSSALEHISNPDKVFQQIYRVLKPGGLAFITVPFMYPYHTEPNDFRRWTHSGLEDSLPGLECVEKGSVFGPFSTIHVLLSSFFAWMFSFESYPMYVFLNFGFQWFFLPIKIIDVVRGVYQKPTPLDSLVYFVGKKSKGN